MADEHGSTPAVSSAQAHFDNRMSIAREWHAALQAALEVRRGLPASDDEHAVRRSARMICAARPGFSVAALYRLAAELVARSHPMMIVDLVAAPRRPSARHLARERRLRAVSRKAVA